MKRRILIILFSLCMTLSMLLTVAAASVETARVTDSSAVRIGKNDSDVAYPAQGGNIYFNEATGTVTACDKSVTAAVIPSEIKGTAVTTIGALAFVNCSVLSSVTIPDSVTSIEAQAFADCSSLTTVAIGNSVTYIGVMAFRDCVSLTTITIGDRVESIGSSAFENCSALKSVSIPDYVAVIGDDAFRYCSSLTSVTIGNSVTIIGNYAFEGCESLASVTIPDSVAHIGNAAFRDCTRMTSVSIGNGVTTIGASAFASCLRLTSVTIPDSVTSIGDSAFEDCVGLTRVTMGNGVTAIGENVFYACESLKSVAIGSSVTSIGFHAFYGCTSLTTVTIPDSVTSVDEGAFYGCEGLTSVTIGKSVERIGEFAFYHCTGLTTVTIPESVTMLEQGAFYECANLKSVYFLGDAPIIGSWAFQVFVADTVGDINIPGLMLYYIEGKSGWTSPTWNGYPTAAWSNAPQMSSFTDVPQGAWYVDSVNYVVKNGLMNGMGKNEFRPEEAMTRAMLVTVLWRYAGSPSEGTNVFHDLTQDWYVQAVAWASSNGIVTGYPDGTFQPDGKVTREQLATILYRYCNTVGIETSARGDLTIFPDARNVNSYASDAVSWAVSAGLITGITHGGNPTAYLEPQTGATRAQVATILMRFIEKVEK